MVYEVHVYCDGCGRHEPSREVGIETSLTKAAKTVTVSAEQHGWKRIGRKWLCVDCQKRE